MQYIDTNILLRYLLNDHAEHSLLARKIIAENIVNTPIEVLCEAVFVLKRVYGATQKDIADTFLDFYENTNCILPHREAVLRGIKYFGEKDLDFVDCILAGYCETENINVQTFDKKLENLIASIQKSKN